MIIEWIHWKHVRDRVVLVTFTVTASVLPILSGPQFDVRYVMLTRTATVIAMIIVRFRVGGLRRYNN